MHVSLFCSRRNPDACAPVVISSLIPVWVLVSMVDRAGFATVLLLDSVSESRCVRISQDSDLCRQCLYSTNSLMAALFRMIVLCWWDRLRSSHRSHGWIETQAIRLDGACVRIDGNCQKQNEVRREETSSRWQDVLPQEQWWVAWRLSRLSRPGLRRQQRR